MQKTGEKDLTEGSVWRQVLSYAMPLVFSSLLQALYSMVDTIIVGHYVGASGISAINNSGQIVNLITKIIIGLTTGGNIVVGKQPEWQWLDIDAAISWWANISAAKIAAAWTKLPARCSPFQWYAAW